MSTPTFFVTGGTGCQGGAVTRQLLSDGHTVHALARNPDSLAAQKLKDIGVWIFAGDFDNELALEAGMQGCKGMFLVVPPADHDTTLRYIKTILTAAKKTGTIEHVVISTTLGTDRPERLAAWRHQLGPDGTAHGLLARVVQPKIDMEQLVRSSGFKYYTILRPGNFMANFIDPKIRSVNPDLASTGIYRTSYTPQSRLPLTDEADTAKFCAAAFSSPARFHGKEIAVVSQLATVDEIMESLSRVAKKNIYAYYLTAEEIEEAAAKFLPVSWHKDLRDMDCLVEMEEVKAWGVPLNTFNHYLERQGECVKETFSQI